MFKGLALFYGIVIVALIVMCISSTDNGVALSDGPIIDDGHRQRFMYPAHQTNFENGHLPYESRVSLENCIADLPNEAICFRRTM
jgi:hypothetical protein